MSIACHSVFFFLTTFYLHVVFFFHWAFEQLVIERYTSESTCKWKSNCNFRRKTCACHANRKKKHHERRDEKRQQQQQQPHQQIHNVSWCKMTSIDFIECLTIHSTLFDSSTLLSLSTSCLLVYLAIILVTHAERSRIKFVDCPVVVVVVCLFDFATEKNNIQEDPFN